ncbi:SurA N-terminal domain-containing protein [Candidatus Saccharibacteria bacterium]|nr:SurA N-terminal domain-containing protein [Candidatus Saccharibacteria bacterium]
MKKRLKKLRDAAGMPFRKLRRKDKDVLENTKVSMITNDTIAEHREEVLAGARKYIYPLQHSKHRIVILSSVIFAVTVIAFSVYSLLSLYRFQTTSTFMYRVTQVIPFPVAKVDNKFVTYENYLFELRHYIHYYRTQQKLSFDTDEGKQELKDFKKQAMDRVINDTFVKQLAEKNGVQVTNQEVDREIAVLRQQNRLGTNDKVFEDVLRDFWGWSLSDFRRSVRQQLLARKIVSKLDNSAHDRAEAALSATRAGREFADVAKEYSDDTSTKETGGDYGIVIDESSRDVAAKVTEVIFNQEAGKVSEIIDTGYSLEIIKTLSFEGDKARAAHIQINFKDISEYIMPLQEAQTPRYCLKV